MGRPAPCGRRARPVRFATWLRVGGTPAQLGTQPPPPPPPAPSLLRGSGSGVPGNAHTHVSTVFTLSQLCPQRGPSRAASAGPRAAPRFADVTSVLFKARRSGAATALTERRPPTASPASCPRQPLLSPSPALVPSRLPFSGLPVCTLGKGGVAACGLCIWLHSAVASPVPGTIRGEQVPTLAVCSRGPSAFPLSRRCCRGRPRGALAGPQLRPPPAVCAGPHVGGRHMVSRLCSAVHVHAGRPPPRSRGLGGTPSD